MIHGKYQKVFLHIPDPHSSQIVEKILYISIEMLVLVQNCGGPQLATCSRVWSL